MKLLTIKLLFCGALLAQSVLTLNSSPGVIKPGSTVTLKVDSTVIGAAGLQWTITFPAGILPTNSIGTQAATAQKQLTCAPGATSTICIVWGLNQNVIATGEVATYSFTLPAGTPPGPFNVILSAVIAGDANASSLPLTAGPPLVLTVVSSFDLNGDSRVDIADVSLAVDQAANKTACSTADFNGDTRCDLIDVLLVVLSALGR